MTDETNDGGREILMPFLPVQSKGGPYDDNAYTAGWEMGQLWHVLEMSTVIGVMASMQDLTIHRANREQADLIAMHFGFVAEFTEYDDEWTRLSLKPGTEVDS
jgi:hypothetical protein